MELMDAIYHRRSVRAFTSAPVDRATITRLIDAAVQAPSAVNRQSWAFAVLQDAGLLARYAEGAKQLVLERIGPPLRDHVADPGYQLFHGAPALILLLAKPGNEYATIDCCLAAENLMLAAYGLGLGTCWIGFARDWFNLPTVKRELAIPAGYEAVAPIIVGHPKGAVAGTPRSVPEIVCWR